VSDSTRIARVVPTIRHIAEAGGRVVLLAHFGRPKGGPDEINSLRRVAEAMEDHVGHPVSFLPHTIGEPAVQAVMALQDGDVLLLENTRFHKGEETNEDAFIDALAQLGDIYVNDAFSAAHRAHASTEGLARRLPAYAGRAMQAELDALTRALERPERPVAAIVGGAKVSTKLDLLGNLVKKVDILIIGGGMANTFLAAQGKDVGKSLCEHDLTGTAREILADAGACEIVLPVDATVAKEFKAGAPSRVVPVDEVGADEMILDIGPRSVEHVLTILRRTKTLVWNGPFGAFELKPFDAGTVAVAQAAARLTEDGQLVTIAGGGDTVSALNAAGVGERFTYLSTAGGAFLEWLEGKTLPGVEALRKKR
jgi:phosphoglycerate kinase